jgi:CO/xanthine dehydrogenase Mo-binding subunit
MIKIDRGGGVAVFCGSTDIGQGSDSILAYVAAEELGIEPEDIRVVTADTDLTPVDLGSYSSRVTLMTGNATIEAARKLRAQLFEVVAEKLGVPFDRTSASSVEPLRAAHRRIFDPNHPEKGMSFVEAAVLAEARFGTLGATGSYTPPKGLGKYKGAGVGPTPTYSYSAAVVELHVDPDTGCITVDKVWLAHDIGKAINPLLVIGQIEGSVYMALGEALMEEQVFRKGVHKLPSMLEYKSPTFLETPEMESILVETLDPAGPYGAKEVGQGVLLPVVPAVLNAIYDAVGVRIDEVPASPDKIVRALEAKRLGRIAGNGRLPSVVFPQPTVVEPVRSPSP